jgi:drug/metabolite transporter (DMT)-like permease
MSWLIITLASYFLSALAIILDKFILGSKKVSSPPVYAFYIGLMGLGALLFAPFGFSIPPISQIILSLIAGSLFTYGILALYFAIKVGEAGRVAPLAGAIIPLGTYLLSILFFSEKASAVSFLGAVLLILGGLLISFDLPLKLDRKKFFPGFKFAVLSGLILAVAYSFLKLVYNEQDFFNGFIWTRLGSIFAIASFFAVPEWRKNILRSLNNFKRPKPSHIRTGALVVLNKIAGGTASILFNYAIALGSVTLVNALVASQYVFILILVAVFSIWHKEIFQEKLYFWDWAQKVAAIGIIGAGVYLVANLGGRALF